MFELLGSVQNGPKSGRLKTDINDENVEEVRVTIMLGCHLGELILCSKYRNQDT